MLCKSIIFVACLLIAGDSVGQTGQLEVKDAWARATPGRAENGATYLTIVSPTTDRLTGASSPVAKKVELHKMSMEGGVMKMRPLAAIDIPAGQTVTLSPGGTHIMLLGLARPLREGQSFPLSLSFDHAGLRQVTVAIEGGRYGTWRASGRIASDAYASLNTYLPSTNSTLCVHPPRLMASFTRQDRIHDRPTAGEADLMAQFSSRSS